MTALNFPDSPSNGATYQGYTYNSTKTAWAKPDTPDPDARTAVYANIAALPTSGTAGDMAYVTATNRLYIWTGTGWYNIALINNTPTISGVNASYALAIDGTATTVTITAADPEGLPITYSIVSDTSGNTATVTQGTGASTNVFTITPSTNTAHAGTFSLTFRASDGVNIASSAASFTLQFKVVNQKYTTALITSVGANNAVNTSFDDKSTSNHTITASGDAHQTTFSPYRHGGYSTYFDGTTDYLKVTDSAEHDFGTGDFSMEFFWWPETVTGNSGNIHIMVSAPNNSHNQLIYHESNYWYFNVGSGNPIASSTGAATAKAWNHVVFCRSGTTMSIFSNGTRTATVTYSGSIDFSHASIGRYNSGSYEIDGYVRDMRWLKGSSAYDATQTSLTVPEEPLTAITNTTLLTCHLPYIADGSTTGHAITVNGNTKTLPFAPYDAQEYSAASHGGSIVFDGTGDYLTAPNASANFGTGEFRVECWLYPNAIGNVTILGNGGITLGHWSGNLQIYNGGFRDAGHDLKNNIWHHVVWQRNSSGVLETCLNGKKASTGTTDTGNKDTTSSVRIGLNPANVEPYNGSIADLRVVIGSGAAYTADFTPTTSPNTAITNTSLLLQGTDAGIIDKSQSSEQVKLFADAKSSTTQAKFLSSSISLDGTGDYIELKNQQETSYGTSDFTIETWAYFTAGAAGSAYRYLFGQGSGTSGTNNLGLYIQGNVLKVWHNGAATITGTTTISLNSWYHIALSRNGTNLKLFLNGTQEGSTATNSSNITSTATGLSIGRWAEISDPYYFAGYISDFRITKGLARYTANFTAPTAALKG